jgi:hypothetical protein
MDIETKLEIELKQALSKRKLLVSTDEKRLSIPLGNEKSVRGEKEKRMHPKFPQCCKCSGDGFTNCYRCNRLYCISHCNMLSTELCTVCSHVDCLENIREIEGKRVCLRCRLKILKHLKHAEAT